jgi:hypothetical protein
MSGFKGKEVNRLTRSEAKYRRSAVGLARRQRQEPFPIEEVGIIAITKDQLPHLACCVVGLLIGCHQERSKS